jgi:hypothetical protein
VTSLQQVMVTWQQQAGVCVALGTGRFTAAAGSNSAPVTALHGSSGSAPRKPA